MNVGEGGEAEEERHTHRRALRVFLGIRAELQEDVEVVSHVLDNLLLLWVGGVRLEPVAKCKVIAQRPAPSLKRISSAERLSVPGGETAERQTNRQRGGQASCGGPLTGRGS